MLHLRQKRAHSVLMPAALDVNRDAIKTLVLAVGCTEASKQTGIPLNTILSWSARGKWLDLSPVKPNLPPTVRPIAINAISAPEALKASLSDDSKRSKIGFSKAARKVAEHLAEASPAEIMKRSGQLLNTVKAAATVHGWQAATSGGNTFNLALLCDQAAIQVVSTDPTISE